jgi:hypothetical protein
VLLPEARSGFIEHVVLRVLDEPDLFPGLLLERGDDLDDRLIRLAVKALLPPYHEVGGLRAPSGAIMSTTVSEMARLRIADPP